MTVDRSGVADAKRLEEGVWGDELAQCTRHAMHAGVGSLPDGRDLSQDVSQPLARLDIGRMQSEAGQRLRELRDGGGIASAVVVEHDHDPPTGVPEIVERLVRHASSERPISNDSNHSAISAVTGELALELIGRGHPVGIGEDG